MNKSAKCGREIKWGIFIERIRNSCDRTIGEEQYGFRERRGCVDLILAMIQMCEKYLGVNNEVYMALMDLDKNMIEWIVMHCDKS